MRCSIPENKFQFYLSSIKRSTLGIRHSIKIAFQFYLSSIKSERVEEAKQEAIEFQFYLSSIKSIFIRFVGTHSE